MVILNPDGTVDMISQARDSFTDVFLEKFIDIFDKHGASSESLPFERYREFSEALRTQIETIWDISKEEAEKEKQG